MKYILSALIPVLFIVSILPLSCGPNIKENVYLEKNSPEEEDVTNIVLPAGKKIIILPFNYQESKKKFTNPDIIKNILFNSLYSFFSLIPKIDLPEKKVLSDLHRRKVPLEDIISNYQPDQIIYGNYILTGSKAAPEIQIKMQIWSKISKNIFSYTFKSPSDEDIFDTIDTISAQIIKSVLNEEMKLAFLNINNCKIGKHTFELYINNKLVGIISNDDFSLSLKLLANTDYWIRLKRPEDRLSPYFAPVKLKQGETSNISFMLTNLIKDGEFEETKDILSYPPYGLYTDTEKNTIGYKWHFILDNGFNPSSNPQGRAKIEEEKAHITIKNTGGSFGIGESIQLSYIPVPLKTGKVYILSFDARSSGEKTIVPILCQVISREAALAQGGIRNYTSIRLIRINDRLKNYSFAFRMGFPSDKNARLAFLLGLDSKEVWIDNVKVETMEE